MNNLDIFTNGYAIYGLDNNYIVDPKCVTDFSSTKDFFSKVFNPCYKEESSLKKSNFFSDSDSLKSCNCSSEGVYLYAYNNDESDRYSLKVLLEESEGVIKSNVVFLKDAAILIIDNSDFECDKSTMYLDYITPIYRTNLYRPDVISDDTSYRLTVREDIDFEKLVKKILKEFQFPFEWGVGNYHEVMIGNCPNEWDHEDEESVIASGDYRNGFYQNGPEVCSSCYTGNPCKLEWSIDNREIVLYTTSFSTKLPRFLDITAVNVSNNK